MMRGLRRGSPSTTAVATRSPAHTAQPAAKRIQKFRSVLRRCSVTVVNVPWLESCVPLAEGCLSLAEACLSLAGELRPPRGNLTPESAPGQSLTPNHPASLAQHREPRALRPLVAFHPRGWIRPFPAKIRQRTCPGAQRASCGREWRNPWGGPLRRSTSDLSFPWRDGARSALSRSHPSTPTRTFPPRPGHPLQDGLWPTVGECRTEKGDTK